MAEEDAAQIAVDGVNGSQAVEVSTQNDAVTADEAAQPDSSVTDTAEVRLYIHFQYKSYLQDKLRLFIDYCFLTEVIFPQGDAGTIADMLRATAEEAMTQTGFVFDETTGMYYDHSTGFYYDSVRQIHLCYINSFKTAHINPRTD